MNNNETKREVKIDNSAYIDRFRFLLTANEDIICERYFKINHFNTAAFVSDEMRRTIKGIVDLIKNDLTSKSRIYEWYTTDGPVKITGFLPNGMGVKNPDSVYVSYPEKRKENEDEHEEEQVIPYDVMFKFEFQMAQTVGIDSDGKPTFSNYKKLYEAVWDGTVYQKDIRHKVDLTNSMSPYKNRDMNSLNFVQSLNYHMILGRQDLVYEIIKRICDTVSGEDKKYTAYSLYGTSTVVKEVGKPLRLITNKMYDEYRRDENHRPIEIVEREVYSDPDGVMWTKLLDGTYRKVVDYSFEPYRQYVQSWEEVVREKTDAYRAGFAYQGRRK